MEGTSISILLSVQQKEWKQRSFSHQQRQLHTGCVDAVFHRTFLTAGEKTNFYYQETLERQAGPKHRMPDITLLNMMTFTALALQMGH
jgi:hypothetical protein